MKNSILMILFVMIFISFTACVDSKNAAEGSSINETFYSIGAEDSEYAELHKVKDNIWVHTTYRNYKGARTPSNGLVVITSEGLVLIDTPWNNGQTKMLLKLAESKFKKKFIMAIITHAHDDRIGGIDTLLENNIDVRSTKLTAAYAEKYGFKKPSALLDSKPEVKVGDLKIETYYPGEGHSADNIVVWLPQSRLLFGGCIIKSMESDNLGSISDANLEQWPISVEKLSDKYKEAEIIVPGHGKWGGSELIEHTLKLLK
ncbi:MAG: subclass B1 metallo-beta-lactamase [Bacillota bacterium]